MNPFLSPAFDDSALDPMRLRSVLLRAFLIGTVVAGPLGILLGIVATWLALR